MNAMNRCLFLAALGVGATFAAEASAQPRNIDRDRDGGLIIQWRQETNRPNANYVLPFDGSNRNSGSYYVEDNRYYYAPRRQNNNRRGQVDPRAYEFGSFSHVDDLAMRLERLANDLCLDLHYNYSHNRGFRETYAEAYRILQAAQFVHEAEHRQDRRGIYEKMRGMDALIHHIQEDVRGWSRHEHRQIGRTDMRTKMELVENTIHHLMYDVGVEHAGGHDHHGPEGPGRGDFGQAPRPR